MKPVPRLLAGVLTAGSLLIASPASAAAPTKQQCAQAYAETQSQTKAGKLRAAREQALVCVQPACPGIVTKDCGPWLEELERNLPTVVLGGHGPTGEDLAAVRVTLDGEAFATRLGGDALPVDPGEHTFRFEIAGAPPIDVKAVIRVGEKNRRIDASFAPPPPPPVAPDRGPPPPSVSPAVFALGGIAIVGLGVFATFATLGENQKAGFDRTCAPNCSPDQASSVRTKLIIGDVGLFTAIAAVGVGTTVFFVGRARRPAPPLASLRVEIAPGPSGPLLTARARF